MICAVLSEHTTARSMTSGRLCCIANGLGNLRLKRGLGECKVVGCWIMKRNGIPAKIISTHKPQATLPEIGVLVDLQPGM